MTLIPATVLAAVAVLGATLGVLTAKAIYTREPAVYAPFDLFGSHVQSGVTLEPLEWTACLEDDQWTALYTWDTNAKVWLHFFNTEYPGSDIPAYVNMVGGLTAIRSTTGIYIAVPEDIPNAQFPTTDAEAANCITS